MPVARALRPEECAGSPHIRDHATEFELKRLGVPHRRRRLHLLAAGGRKLDEIAYDPFGHAEGSGGMKKGEKLRQRCVLRPGHEWRAAFEIRKIRGGDDFV